jgi:hypothetical protein
MEPHYSNGTLVFRSDYNIEYPLLISQLKGFKPGSKMLDDGPDMLELCVSGMLNFKKKTYSFNSPGQISSSGIHFS